MGSLIPKLKILNRIRVLRAEKNITQQELAEAVEVTRATILAIENGNYNPSLELAFRVSAYFKKDINAIFFIKEEES